jgi:HK97 family phage portal protein
VSLFRRTEARAVTFQDVWGSGGNVKDTVRGDLISTALRLAPVYSATSLIANLIATAPKAGYRESSPGVLAKLSPQPQLVTNPAPFFGSCIPWWHQGVASVLLTGNAYGYVVDIDSAGVPTKVIWMHPNDVTIIEEQNDMLHTPQFFWRGRLLDPMFVVHVPGYVMPGSIKGLSPIGLFKTQIETGLSAQDFQLDWYNNGAAPSGWFKNTAQTLKDGDADKIKSRFKASVKNRDLLVTGNDWAFEALSVPADQAQFLQAIQANATTVASIFHVAPEDVGGTTGHPLTYKTLEQDGIKLNTRALRPWASRFEEVLSNLLPRPQFVSVDLDGLARGTVIERMQAHQVALLAGLETNDEGRAIEGRPPLTPEQVTFWQDNYKAAPAAAPVDDTPPDDPADTAEPAAPNDKAA